MRLQGCAEGVAVAAGRSIWGLRDDSPVRAVGDAWEVVPVRVDGLTEAIHWLRLTLIGDAVWIVATVGEYDDIVATTRPWGEALTL